MVSLHDFTSSPTSCFRRLLRGISALAAAGALAAALSAQNVEPEPAPPAPAPADANANANANDNGTTAGSNARPRRGAYSPEQMLANLRERMGVTDDAEWAIISARITAIVELRRGSGGFAGRGGRTSDGSRPAPASNPEVDALREAVSSNLPDAEVKARLARLHDVRKQNEAKLEKAREDLRAVLSVRQEAIAVLSGLLP